MKYSYKITLVDGREIHLDDFHQYFTYQTIIVSGGPFPNRMTNKKCIKDAIKKSKQVIPYCYGPVGWKKPYLVEPLQTKKIGEKVGRVIMKQYWLPLITCMGCFTSWTPREKMDEDSSRLIIIWYQDAFALPIEDNILSQIKTINWNKLAIGVDGS